MGGGYSLNKLVSIDGIVVKKKKTSKLSRLYKITKHVYSVILTKEDYAPPSYYFVSSSSGRWREIMISDSLIGKRNVDDPSLKQTQILFTRGVWLRLASWTQEK